MLHLKQFRRQAAGFTDLLNYAALIDSGVVLCKDGSLLAGFVYEGYDAQTLSIAEREAISARFNSALSQLGSGWASWTEAVRLPAPGYSDPALAHFPDDISRLIDAERRDRFAREGARFEAEHVLIVQYRPPRAAATKVVALLIEGAARRPASLLDYHLEQFEKTLSRFEDAFLGAVRIARRMRSFPLSEDRRRPELWQDELVNTLQKFITGAWDANLNIPPVPMYMDGWIAGVDFYPGSPARIGERYVRCVALEGFPSSSFPGILDGLDQLAMAYRWSNRMIHLDGHEAVAALERYRSRWRQRVRGIVDQVFNTGSTKVNLDALAMAEAADQAIASAQDGRLGWGYASSIVVLMDEDLDRLETQARGVAQLLRAQGFMPRIETWNGTEAFLGSLPGHMDPNVRRPLIHTGNAADMAPISTAWPGLRRCPSPRIAQPSRPLIECVSPGATDFAFNVHVDDVGHHLVFGPTGTGKSTLLNSIAAAFLAYENARVTVIDRGGSSMALCHAIGGAHYDLGREGAPGLCPLEHIETEEDLAWAEDWLSVCYELQAHGPIEVAQRTAIRDALRTLAGSDHERSLSSFLANLPDRTLREALEAYAVDGKYGLMLDAEAGAVSVGDFTVFEVEALLQRGDEITIPVLLLLFRMVERGLQGRPAMLLVDEAWAALKHPAARDKIGEWLRTLRKRNAAVGLYTQSLADVSDSEIAGLLNDNCPTKIFLANPEARNRPQIYELFGLRAGAIQTIAEATPKREYFYASPLGERLFSLMLGPVALSFVGASSSDDQAAIRNLISRHASDWPRAWLKSRGVAFDHLREKVHAG